jgi:hypothetical protein
MTQRIHREVILWLGAAVWLVLGSAGILLAAEASQVSISQGYKTSGEVVVGSLVGLDRTAPDTVRPATSDQLDDVFGVVVQSAEPLLSVSAPGSTVQVATTGVVTALVCDLNGTIKQGDRVSVSPIAGIGMKMLVSGRILGSAQANFDDATDKQTVTIKDKTGADKQVTIGRLSVLVEPAYYTAPGSLANAFVPPVLQNFSNAVAGHEVSPVRVLLSGLLILVALIIAVSLVSSSVRSSIISIGRNPLSQHAVRRSLLQVLVFIVAILLVTLISVYFILM